LGPARARFGVIQVVRHAGPVGASR